MNFMRELTTSTIRLPGECGNSRDLMMGWNGMFSAKIDQSS